MGIKWWILIQTNVYSQIWQNSSILWPFLRKNKLSTSSECLSVRMLILLRRQIIWVKFGGMLFKDREPGNFVSSKNIPSVPKIPSIVQIASVVTGFGLFGKNADLLWPTKNEEKTRHTILFARYSIKVMNISWNFMQIKREVSKVGKHIV